MPLTTEGAPGRPARGALGRGWPALTRRARGATPRPPGGSEAAARLGQGQRAKGSVASTFHPAPCLTQAEQLRCPCVEPKCEAPLLPSDVARCLKAPESVAR